MVFGGPTLQAFVAALLLALSLAQSAPQNPACEGAAAENLTGPVYLDTTVSVKHSIAPFVHSFLGTVQPNAFPHELIMKLMNDVINEENIREALIYEVGFLVCAAIGLVYLVLMPLVGLFFACCRCCGNCGGKMLQKQTSSTGCRRRTLYWSTFFTTVVIFAGNVIMFKGNNDFRDSLLQTPEEVNNNLENVDIFLSAVPQQLNYVVNESFKTVNEVEKNLDDIGALLGGQIQNRLNSTLETALSSVRLLDQETGTTNEQLGTLNSLLTLLQTDVDKLKTDVKGVKDRVSLTINKPACVGCSAALSPLLDKLDLDSLSISTSSLDDINSAVGQIDALNLPSKIIEVENFYNEIPQTVAQETAVLVTDSKKFLNDIKSQISTVTDEIPLATLSDVSQTIQEVQGNLTEFTPAIQAIELIRWQVGLAVCFVVLLVVVCNFLGLLLGPIGLRSHEDPTQRSCTADCGGVFFMMSAGFSFLFSWLFMIVVLVLFLVGGGFYTLGCKPWDSGELLKFVDANYELGPLLGFSANITYSQAYGDCLNNKTVWTTLHLSETVNLDELLDVSKYTGEIQDKFDKTDITLADITILTPADKNQLNDFASSATDLDMSAVTQEMDNIYKVNLNASADELDNVADSPAITDSTIKAELKGEAADLRKIQSWAELTIYPRMESISSTMQSLESSTGKISATVPQVLNHVSAAQDFLNTDTSTIIKAESQKILDCQLGYFTVYADWAKAAITMELGRCGQVAKTVQSVETILCSQLVDSMNTFWFGLGWCLVFFIPSIILSIKLAKFYRKMKYTDVFEDE